MSADMSLGVPPEPVPGEPMPLDVRGWGRAQWSALVECHPTAMLVIDPEDGHIVHANRAAERFYGWSRAELCSRTISDINTLSVEEVAAEMQAARRAERAYFRFRHRLASGEVRDVEVHSGPVPIGDRELLFSLITDGAERREAMAALRASDELARNIISSAPVGIAVADLDGQLVDVNPAMTAITGYDRDELIGWNLRQLTHPDDLASTDDHLARLREEPVEAYQLEKRYVREDGSNAIVAVSSSLLRDAAGAPHRYLGIVHDHTANRRLTEHAQQLTATIDAAADVIITLEDDGTIGFINRRFEVVTGIARDAAIGRSLWQLFEELEGSGLRRVLQIAHDRGSHATLIDRCGPFGRWTEVHAYPSGHGLALFLRDVTERIERETLLAQQARSDRADAERLRRLDKTKNAFLSAVSHELRTPLTVMVGMSETLAARRAELDAASVARLEASLCEQSKLLSRLVDDLLQVDRLSRGGMVSERSRFDVVELVRRVSTASTVSDRLELRLPASRPVVADPVQVEQTLMNLLSNAAKYAPEGPVHVGVEAVGDDGFRLVVRDRGPGIPAHVHARVFEPFWRLDDDHPTPGTGIGLALVAEFAALHGGRAWVESPSGGGAQLVVEFPGAPG